MATTTSSYVLIICNAGIGLKYKDCNGSQWQSYEKTYVDTLCKRKQNELHAVISGKRVGVDMGLIMDMRLGATASSRDYISVEPKLLRELGSSKSQISMAR
eukprot:scaffold10807_cov89-Skeletonema_menzelii.AAC.1